jgi:hypothetical protein
MGDDAVLKEYERYPAPRPVWVRHEPGQWYPGHSLGRLRWPGRPWSEQEVVYDTDLDATHHRTVSEDRVTSRRPMAEPERNAPCAQCGTSREDCDRREQAEWPPYCCTRCWRYNDNYALHVRPELSR